MGGSGDQLARFYDDNTFSVSDDYATTPSFDSSYVSFVVNVDETGAGPLVSVTANGTTLISNFSVDFDSNDRYFNFGTHSGTEANNPATDFSDLFIDNLTITSIPEPSSTALLSIALGGLMLRRRR